MGLVIYSNAGGDGDLLLAKPSLPCKSISAKEKDKAVHLTWEDPNSPEDTSLYSEWASTRIVRKEGGFPVDENDGVVVVISTTKNEYKDTAYVDSGLTNGTTYYYRAFTYSVDGVYNTSDSVQLSATPRPFRTMTVTIDLNDSNPETCGSYTDDAVGMPSGKTDEAIAAWQDFFGYKPCLFKDGKVVGYLNPNDYSKFENGEDADITSGDAGDVMIEFPRRGIKISKSGKIVTVSMTDDLDDLGFTHYAHTRGETKKEYFYIGAYLGFITNNKLRSLSDKVKSNKNNGSTCYAEDYRDCAHANGTGYEMMTYYQWMYIQVMYLLQFRGNLDSQSSVGVGLNDENPTSGSLDNFGLIYGSSSSTASTKLFGMEDIWAACSTFIDGCALDSENVVYLATDAFNNKHDGYKKYQSYTYSRYGYTSDVVGNSEVGFFPIDFSGSTTTYFCDMSEVESSAKVASIGRAYHNADKLSKGLFGFGMYYGGAISDEFAARLSYY